MSYDLLLENNDIVVTENGDLSLATTKADLARQWVQVRLKTLLTEWFLDQNQGIDWLNLLSSRNNRDAVDSIIKRTIADTQYIVRILSYRGELDRSTRKYNVTFSASVETGDVITINNLEI